MPRERITRRQKIISPFMYFRILFFLFAFSFAFSPSLTAETRVTGVIYYICDNGPGADPDCVPGSDNYLGMTPRAPWRTYEKARSAFERLRPGDAIAFARGGSFEITPDKSMAGTKWINYNARADRPITICDYTPPWASGDEGKPIIRALNNASAFRLSNGSAGDHIEGYIIKNLELQGLGSEREGIFIYNDVDDVILDNLVIDGFSIGVHSAGVDVSAFGMDARNERITLRNSRILNNKTQGWLGGGTDQVIENNYFENNGFGATDLQGAIRNHNIYISSPSGSSSGMRIRNNELYRSAVFEGKSSGASLVVHGKHEDLMIQNNIMREDIGASDPHCWGIAVDTGYSSDEGFRDIVIRKNRIVNVGNVGIGLAACRNGLIENNVIIHAQRYAFKAVAAPTIKRGDNDLPMTNVDVRYNSIYVDNNYGGTGISLGGEGNGHSVLGNEICYTGSGGDPKDENAWTCLKVDLDYSAYEAINNNLCYFPNTTRDSWINDNGSRRALEDWQLVSSFDKDSSYGPPDSSAFNPGL